VDCEQEPLLKRLKHVGIGSSVGEELLHVLLGALTPAVEVVRG